MLLWRSRVVRASGVVIGRERRGDMPDPRSRVLASRPASLAWMMNFATVAGDPSAMIVHLSGHPGSAGHRADRSSRNVRVILDDRHNRPRLVQARLP
jgi:hypothetical protein